MLKSVSHSLVSRISCVLNNFWNHSKPVEIVVAMVMSLCHSDHHNPSLFDGDIGFLIFTQLREFYRFDIFEEKVFGIRAGKGCSSSFHSDLGDLLRFLQVSFSISESYLSLTLHLKFMQSHGCI